LRRARAAQASIAGYSQDQVDELVTAVAWAVVRKDRAEALAQLTVDEGGFGNYADKLVKINKRVTGVLADMRSVRTVGVVEEDPEQGLVKIAKPVGVVAALIPTTGPDATPPVQGPLRPEGPQRHRRGAAPPHAGEHGAGGRLHAGSLPPGRRPG